MGIFFEKIDTEGNIFFTEEITLFEAFFSFLFSIFLYTKFFFK